MTENMNGVVGEWEGIPLTAFTPNPNEAIVCHFDFNNGHLDTMQRVFENLKEAFPENSIVLLPDRASLESCSKDVMEMFRDMITEVIESL